MPRARSDGASRARARRAVYGPHHARTSAAPTTGSERTARKAGGPGSADADLEEERPELAADEDAPGRGIVGDAVQHRALVPPLARGQESRQVEVRRDAARRGVDPDDVVRVPDVGPHLALDELELVEVRERPAVPGDVEPPGGREALRVEVGQDVGAVAQDETRPVVREPPPLALVAELPEKAEARQVVDEPAARAPGQLDEAIPHAGKSLAEDVGGELQLAQDATARELDPPQRGPADEARALEESPLVPDEPLEERVRVVRVAAHDVPLTPRRGRDGRVARRRGLRARRLARGQRAQQARERDGEADAPRPAPGQSRHAIHDTAVAADLRTSCRRAGRGRRTSGGSSARGSSARGGGSAIAPHAS